MIKSKTIQFGAVYLGGVLLAAGAEHRYTASKEVVIKPRVTHAALQKRQKPKRDFGEREAVPRERVSRTTKSAKESRNGGLVGRSAILSSTKNWSLVPKGAVLHVPKLYEERVNNTRAGTLIGWQDFYRANRSWIRTIPVTIDQASGKTPLTEEYLAGLRKGGQVLIAVCRGGPISVKLPEPEEGSANPAPAEATPEGREEAAKKAEAETKAVDRLKRRLLQRPN